MRDTTFGAVRRFGAFMIGQSWYSKLGRRRVPPHGIVNAYRWRDGDRPDGWFLLDASIGVKVIG